MTVKSANRQLEMYKLVHATWWGLDNLQIIKNRPTAAIQSVRVIKEQKRQKKETLLWQTGY